MVSNRIQALLVAVVAVTAAAGAGLAVASTAPADRSAGEAAPALGQAGGTAFLRVVHVSPDAGPVDVFVDGRPALTNVPFAAVSDYLPVPAGEHRITITGAGNQTNLAFEGNVTLEADTNYTVAAIGEVTPDASTIFQPLVLVDDAPTPAQDEAAVRLVHASPDAPTVDVTVAGTGDVLFDNASYGEPTDYVTVPAGNYTLEVRAATAEGDGDVVSTANVSLAGGTAYTAYANGYLDPATAAGDEPFRIGFTIDPTAGPSVPVDNETVTPADNETATETTETAG